MPVVPPGVSLRSTCAAREATKCCAPTPPPSARARAVGRSRVPCPRAERAGCGAGVQEQLVIHLIHLRLVGMAGDQDVHIELPRRKRRRAVGSWNCMARRGGAHLSLQLAERLGIAPRNDLMAVAQADLEVSDLQDLLLRQRRVLRRADGRPTPGTVQASRAARSPRPAAHAHLVEVATHDMHAGRYLLQEVQLLLAAQVACAHNVLDAVRPLRSATGRRGRAARSATTRTAPIVSAWRWEPASRRSGRAPASA